MKAGLKTDKSAEKTAEYIRLFKRYYADAHCALNYKNPEELIVATVLSAQCTDDRVNKVTAPLFKKYPSMQAFAKADLSALEQDVRSTGFYKNKAKNIKELARILVAEHGGKVPPDLDTLVKLPGVGRKTANVVLGNAFDITSGIVVDTHVTRLSYRLGLSSSKGAEAIERDLEKIVPKRHWIQFSHWLIWHGRQVCKARKPRCEQCFLDDICPKRGV